MCIWIRPETIDSLVRFSADSKFKGPTKEKNHFFILWKSTLGIIFLFCRPPDSSKKLRDWFEDQGINCPSPYDGYKIFGELLAFRYVTWRALVITWLKSFYDLLNWFG